MNFIQVAINSIIDGVIFNRGSVLGTDVEGGVPSSQTIWDAVNKVSHYREKKIKSLRRAGLLFQKKEDQPLAELEAAIMVYVFYDDHTWSTFFVFADGTSKEMQPPGADYPTP